MMKDLYLQKNRSEAGNTFFTALVFIFVLVGTLRICCNKTLHEAKLTGIFIQETQGYYLLENLMALARDYAYQITQNPREPNLFLSASAYRKKDKTYVQSQSAGSDAWVIDFNGSLSKEQIVPEDFPLKIADNGWDIKGGPIFWQNKKKDDNDERWLSEVFMLGTLNFTETLIPNWTMRMVQTMEIERNPLCDFQIYSEGELSFTTWTKSYIDRTFYGPIQINGSARFPRYRGESGTTTDDHFRNKINIAGHALRGQNNYTGIKLPQKYHMQDNNDIYATLAKPYGTTGGLKHNINKNAVNYSSVSETNISNGLYYSNYWSTDDYQSYEHSAFNVWRGNFSTRSRIYRPCGFDPIGYGGYWKQGATRTVGKNINTNMTDNSTADSLVLDTCFGFIGLCSRCRAWTTGLFKDDVPNDYQPLKAMSVLRKLNEYQMSEKAYLTNTQMTSCGPSLIVIVPLESEEKVSKLFSNNIHWPFTTYLSTSFPATKDNIFFNQYLNIKQNNQTILQSNIRFAKCTFSTSDITSLPTTKQPTQDPNITSKSFYQRIQKNRLVCNSINDYSPYSNTSFSNIFKDKSAFSPTDHGDNTCPPHKLIDCETYWKMDNYMTRIKADASYQFMYDRNRAKWIQIIDFDVQALNDLINNSSSFKADWDKMEHTVQFIGYWPGYHENSNRNYTYNGHDIRQNYASDRSSFFGSYQDGSYESTSNVVDIGIRIINATSLPNGGLTIVSQYPVYIKGSFNSTTKYPKACIIADSITVLSDKWGDWKSQMDPYESYLTSWVKDSTNNKQPSSVSIYAHLITGRTHPNFWIKNDSNLSPDLGLNDAIRTLEYWGSGSDHRIYVYGSIMLPYYAHEQWEPPINFTTYDPSSPNGYGAPPLGSPSETWKSMRTAPGIPFYHRINRGRKTQGIGETSYNTLAGTTLYNKDWDSTSYTFSTYHSALPNFLQYETAP